MGRPLTDRYTLVLKRGNDWPEKIGRSDSKNEKDWTKKVEGPIWKVRGTDSKNGKVWL